MVNLGWCPGIVHYVSLCPVIIEQCSSCLNLIASHPARRIWKNMWPRHIQLWVWDTTPSRGDFFMWHKEVIWYVLQGLHWEKMAHWKISEEKSVFSGFICFCVLQVWHHECTITHFMMVSHMWSLWQWGSKQRVAFIELIIFQAWWRSDGGKWDLRRSMSCVWWRTDNWPWITFCSNDINQYLSWS